jgi:threonylcarbamoyladenosine tRNA methylthiotransferase MtaB
MVTLGCRLNINESEMMRQQAATAGLSDTIIVNTCAVTAEAERQARQTIRRLHREQPSSKIVVTGCAAQIHPESFADMPEVAQVIGNDRKLDPTLWQSLAPNAAPLAEPLERVIVNDIMSVQETAGHLVAGFAGHTRAFVQIQNGCDHRCTFCVIPFGRGNSRSVGVGEVVRQCQSLVNDMGYQEIVLTGVDLTAYGKDLPNSPNLGYLVERILTLVPGLPRLRISSIDSVEVDPLLFELLCDEPRLMPHLHLSLQAGDNMILKRMKRRHNREQSIAFCQALRARRPDMTFGADLIAGFPTETDEMFANSLQLIEDCGLTFLHIFPYSPRPNTPAAKMPQVPPSIRKDRARQLRSAGQAALAKHLASRVGQTTMVLWESNEHGHDPSFAPVRWQPQAGEAPPTAGQLSLVHLYAVENDKHLLATP